MQVAFFKAKHGGLLDWVTNLLTIPEIGYSHVELVFSDNQWWSSRPGKGTAILPPTKVAPRSQWHFIDLDVDYDTEIALRRDCERTKAAYDWFGVIRFVLPFLPVKLSRNHLFCSEACISKLQAHGILDKRHCPPLFIDPNVLSLILSANKGVARECQNKQECTGIRNSTKRTC
jgi:hypothetical protein